jgi:hypothetical protein
MIRSHIVSAALVGGMVFAGAPPARASSSSHLTPAQNAQVQFVTLLLTVQSSIIDYENTAIQNQTSAITKLNKYEQQLFSHPNQYSRLEPLIVQTVTQINAYQVQINQAKPLLLLGQTVVDAAVHNLDLSLYNVSGAASTLHQIDTRAAQEHQTTLAILNRPPATASYPS